MYFRGFYFVLCTLRSISMASQFICVTQLSRSPCSYLRTTAEGEILQQNIQPSLFAMAILKDGLQLAMCIKEYLYHSTSNAIKSHCYII